MPVKLLMGNEAIGLGAVHAGVRFVSGYPGTPSTEVLETVAKNNPGTIHVEWSTNEKAALEAAIGAAYSGARAMVTMKQVGLNVAADPLMTLSYMGVKGGLVLVVADDPGPISSQTEQDTRAFGQFAKVPVLDPVSSGECYGLIQDAFELSERFSTPVILRPTTRVCHACGTVKTRGGIADCAPMEVFKHKELSDTDASWDEGRPDTFEFVKDTQRWVVFPRTSYLNHGKVERRALDIASAYSSGYHPNRIEMGGQHHHRGADAFASRGARRFKLGIACGGISYHYVKEVLEIINADLPVMKVAMPYPFPAAQGLELLDAVDEVLVVEELDPVIERELILLCGKAGIQRTIHGKLDGTFVFAGEQSVETIKAALLKLMERLGLSQAPAEGKKQIHSKLLDMDLSLDEDAAPSEEEAAAPAYERPAPPELPARPPVLCAGCPHRASFYAVKRAMAGRKAVFCGDIGCYTLGNAAPLDMVDTCLCMGADITMAQGIAAVDPDVTAFSFIGDSTFFASGITGVINAVYNQHDIIVCILDNSTTAMTGHQPHPGTGKTMMGVDGAAMSIPAILQAIGVASCETVDPLDLTAAKDAVTRAAAMKGVRCIIFKSPCISVSKPLHPQVRINEEACTDCRTCITQIGCPGLVIEDGRVTVETTQCYGCELCVQVCAFGAIERGEE